MSKNDGGPAFPCHWRSQPNDAPQVMGMTLRDYFAAKAMPVLLERYLAMGNGSYDALSVATRAYNQADAMIAERAK